jgi:spermidine/putrescine ABC transporter ATP-binding subunit
MASLTLERVHKSYGSQAAVADFTLHVPEGQFIVFLGPSGCGKTTTLRMIAGFVDPTSGTIRIGDEDITNVPPRRRNIGMVFQDYALFPNMTVRENIGFGLRQKRVGKAFAHKTVQRLLEMIQLPDKGDAFVDELSGGQQQRIALARALATEPRVLLMDEPLGALDLKLRQAMQVELKRLQQELGVTTVLVTHDQHEAMALADRIVIMNAGRIQQVGTPRELYRLPTNTFVADFLGKTNLVKAVMSAGEGAERRAEIAPGCFVRVQATTDVPTGTPIMLSVRPEDLRLSTGAGTSGTTTRGTVDSVTFLGDQVTVIVRLVDHSTVWVTCPAGSGEPNVGDPVGLIWPEEGVIGFPVGRDADAPL